MKVIINTINYYHIHDNSYHIDNRCNECSAKHSGIKTSDEDLHDFAPLVVVNGHDNYNPLISELKARILQSENEIKELLDKLNNESE
ncbi:hypothetical protein [uncultured Mucilaginibacter sp.]|uniref:hypothetical protein n=1 Tax=uncultured Mucilaginibacter sp. TaxID=797541 RepID=UPI00262831D9|nr:hypothetical protein [uncultured Mucilaginibacter sp.]